jgi:hypothetical protein
MTAILNLTVFALCVSAFFYLVHLVGKKALMTHSRDEVSIWDTIPMGVISIITFCLLAFFGLAVVSGILNALLWAFTGS